MKVVYIGEGEKQFKRPTGFVPVKNGTVVDVTESEAKSLLAQVIKGNKQWKKSDEKSSKNKKEGKVVK